MLARSPARHEVVASHAPDSVCRLLSARRQTPDYRRSKRTRRAIYFGKYELLSRINVGGMAEIVKARDPSTAGDRIVAIKRILPHLCADEHYKTMFMDESRVLAQLDHPSIIHAYEFGEIEATPFIALEYVRGQDAREVFHACLRQGQPLPLGLACYVIARVCEGLQHAHDQTDAQGQSLGVVHRDVSLQNILVGYDGAVKLCDFGIAASAENLARTEAGVVKGKFGYMSPEQVRGAVLDRRSDVFGAGICLYELLTGERLFSGENDYRALERVRNATVEPPSHFNRQIPSSLEHVVLKALAKQPRDRFQSTNDLRRSLQAFLVEARLFLAREDLSAYMRALFANESAASDQELAQQPSIPPRAEQGTALQNLTATAFDDEPTQVVAAHHGPGPRQDASSDWTSVPEVATGLSTFDDVPPVHSLAAEPASAAALGDKPRARESTRLGPTLQSVGQAVAPDADPGAGRGSFEMEWDEPESTTLNEGPEDASALSASASSSTLPRGPRPSQPEVPTSAVVSRQPAEHQSGEPARRASSSPARRMRSVPTLELPQAPPESRLVPAAIVAAFALIAIAITLYFVRDRAVGALRIETEPRQARVFVDGKRVPGDYSPFLINKLRAKYRHNVRVESDGFVSWATTLSVNADTTIALPLVHLERLESLAQPGEVESPEQARAGTTEAQPEPTDEVPAVRTRELPTQGARKNSSEGKRATAAAAETRRTAAASRRAAAAEARRTSVAAKREAAASASAVKHAGGAGTGTLRINTRPWSQISIDGVAYGNTPQMNLEIKAGTHTVTLKNSEFGVKKTFVLTIKPGEVITRVLTLTQ